MTLATSRTQSGAPCSSVAKDGRSRLVRGRACASSMSSNGADSGFEYWTRCRGPFWSRGASAGRWHMRPRCSATMVRASGASGEGKFSCSCRSTLLHRDSGLEEVIAIKSSAEGPASEAASASPRGKGSIVAENGRKAMRGSSIGSTLDRWRPLEPRRSDWARFIVARLASAMSSGGWERCADFAPQGNHF